MLEIEESTWLEWHIKTKITYGYRNYELGIYVHG